MKPSTVALMLIAGMIALVMACTPAPTPRAITMGIHYSRFAMEEVRMKAGVPVTLTLINQDPIEHEWIIGTSEVHERHRSGTEPYHDQIATEVTIPALSTRATTFTLAEPGEYEFICHLPGHEAYGMRGKVLVY